VTDSPSLDDRELLQAHVHGDPTAFAELVRRHRDRLWAVALRTTGDPEDAADAVQDALISAFRRAESFRGEAKVTTWLHRIVVNACLDRMRRRSARPTEPLPDSEQPQRIRADPADVGESPEASDRRADVIAALRQISPDQRAALVLVDMEGYSVDEAADILRCPVGTVKSRCSRGRARLAPLLASYHRNPSAGPPVERTATATAGTLPLDPRAPDQEGVL
jgi:RNA polymerase sigma-70 factor, ECF subfamily